MGDMKKERGFSEEYLTYLWIIGEWAPLSRHDAGTGYINRIR